MTPEKSSKREGGALSWLAIYREPVVLRMFFLGFSSGLPLLLVLGTLSFWMREVGVDLKSIGFMSWVGLCWGMKWLWSPLVDKLRIPLLSSRLGQRRAWLLTAQIGLIVSLALMAFADPAKSLTLTAALALSTAFFGATQDIALDAFRIESGSEEKQAAFAATYQTGYRLAMIWAGAGALAIAAFFETQFGTAVGWRSAYLVMSASMLVGVVTVLLSPEPEQSRRVHAQTYASKREWIFEAICKPFLDFFSRFGWGAAVILVLIATYRISDVVMGVMANPFYADLGFSKEEVAAVSKVFGLIMTLVGAFAGGAIASRIGVMRTFRYTVFGLLRGVMRTLFLGGLLSAATNLLFSALALRGHDTAFLVLTVSADNFAGGLASAAFVAYLSGLTNVAYSATQYALFSSVMLILPKFLAGFSGVAVQSVGYATFFTATAAIGVPVLILVVLAGVVRKKKTPHEAASGTVQD